MPANWALQAQEIPNEYRFISRSALQILPGKKRNFEAYSVPMRALRAS